MKNGLKTKLITGLAIPLMFLSLVSCAKGNDNSAKVTVKVVPDEPVVITTDITVLVGSEDKTFTAPWFYATYNIKNDSDKRLSVIVVKSHSFSQKDGQSTEGNNSYTTSDEAASGIIINIDAHSSGQIGWWFDNNAATDASSPNLNLEVTLQGWFSDMSATKFDANERFEKTLFFSAY